VLTPQAASNYIICPVCPVCDRRDARVV